MDGGRQAAGITGANHDDTHAGELETAILLAAHAAHARYGWRTPTCRLRLNTDPLVTGEI
jgi:hypothetical protein